jgi:hypothetical protein
MRYAIIAAALALSGCATSYQLSVMPRDSGRIFTGVAEDTGYGEGRISLDIDGKQYNGTWVSMAPDRTNAYVSGGFGFGRGRWGWGGLGTMITLDNPSGGESKALLTAADGSGLRCEFRSVQARGGGTCRDDRGREYDVQMRPAPRG